MGLKNGICCVTKSTKSIVILFVYKKQKETTLMNHISGNFVIECMIIFFHLSNEALGGTITIWQSSKFDGELILDNKYAQKVANEYAQMVKFCSSLANESWALINIYAPCTPSGKLAFLQ